MLSYYDMENDIEPPKKIAVKHKSMNVVKLNRPKAVKTPMFALDENLKFKTQNETI